MTDLDIVLNAPEGATPEELAAYLDEACLDSPELRSRVEALMAANGEAEADFLARGPIAYFGDQSAPSAASEKMKVAASTKERIGPYKLLQKIGEGGFGTVWMAEQSGAISRRVALKIVKAGMDTEEVLARFEAERQALAMMDHPNIAKVLDAGATDFGRPYFVMELVKGDPITQFCNDQKYGTRRRLELFRDVCTAVNHAHQKGIIHRDLKPSNVMVTLIGDKPIPKVIDFGIAKATQSKLTDKTLFTVFEQFLGTPVYISPEQAAMSGLDIDTRSDIYSLGVLLYELLAGQPPFDSQTLLSVGYDEMRRIICDDEPLKPSTKITLVQEGAESTLGLSASALKGELDWIVMKAIDKDRTRRYETANAFSNDIGNYLADEPVVAAAPSKAYKIQKFARRNRTAIAIAGAFVLMLVATTAVSAWQAIRATRAGAESEAARTEAEAARVESEAARTEAEAARTESESARTEAEAAKTESELARKEAESIARFLTQLFIRPRSYQNGREVTVAEALASAAEQLEVELANQPAVRANLKETIATTYFDLGMFPEAIKIFEELRGYYESISGRENRMTLLMELYLAQVHSEAGRREEAAKLFEELLSTSKRVLGEKHPATLDTSAGMARAYFHLSQSADSDLLFQQHIEKAIELAERTLEGRLEVLGPEAGGTIRTRSRLSKYYRAQKAGRRDQAVE